jgi:hypothetical protein
MNRHKRRVGVERLASGGGRPCLVPAADRSRDRTPAQMLVPPDARGDDGGLGRSGGVWSRVVPSGGLRARVEPAGEKKPT